MGVGAEKSAVDIKVSVIIVNWNGKQHLSACLDSISTQTYRDYEVILVDNGSEDRSVEFVRGNYPWVSVIPLPENRGFAEGNNTGFAKASGEYLVTLNNDTEVEPLWLEELVRVADTYPDVGMVASRICSYEDHDRIDSLGVKICVDGMSRGAHRLQTFSTIALDKVEEVLLPSACAALYKQRMLAEIGFFDEDFFAYCEDTDLGMRGRLTGWRALLAPDAVVYHKYSQTGGTFSPLKIYLVERNHYWVAFKTFPIVCILMLPLTTIRRYMEQMRLILLSRGSGKDFAVSKSKNACAIAFGRGSVDALKMFPKMWTKRRQLARVKRLRERDLRKLLYTYRLSFRELLDAR